MRVVILCGGQGTRLREETEFRPKPLVSVGEKPILWHIMKTYAHYGFNEFVLCLGYRGELIKEYFLQYEAMNNDFTISLGSRQRMTFHDSHDEQDFLVTLVNTGLNSMTGGRVRRVQRYIDGDTFMVTYGDGVADIDINALLLYHHRHGRIATITAVRPTSRFGIIDVNEERQVVNFTEKPQLDGWASAGYFVFNRRLFEYLDGDDCVLEREPLERLAADGELMLFGHEGFFFAMDTYREYQLLNELWGSGKAPWKVWERESKDVFLLAG